MRGQRKRALASCSVCSATSSPRPASIAASTAALPCAERRTLSGEASSNSACAESKAGQRYVSASVRCAQ